ncbi:chromodomain-helicase-DNA-binding protein 9-like isoform X1 [Arapaima gigas]
MDFFDDPTLFEGGLEGLSDESFAAASVSLVDELNLTAEFEPLQVDSLGTGKHPGLAASSSSQQNLTFDQQIDHFGALKAPHPVTQPFSVSDSSTNGSGSVLAQHMQFQDSPLHPPPQTNGLFPDSSPMWGNQDQNGNTFHQLPQQQSHHHQHVDQHGHFQAHMQGLHQHGKAFSEHQDFYYQGNPAQKQQQQQQQAYHGQSQSFSPSPECNGSLYHHGGIANAYKLSKSHMGGSSSSFSCSPQQQQRRMQSCQGNQKYPGATEDMALPFSRSSMPSTLSACSVSSAMAYSSSQYPLSASRSLASASVPATTTASPRASTIHSAIPEFSGAGDAFSLLPGIGQHQPQHQAPLNQAGDCPFQGLQLPGQAQGNYSSSEMFSESMTCYPGTGSQHPSGTQGGCEPLIPPANSSNGYEALVENLLPQIEAHSEEFEELEGPDLLGDDLLPQLEPALNQKSLMEQQEETSYSWTNGSQAKVNCMMNYMAQPRKNTTGSSNHPRVLSPLKNSLSSSSMLFSSSNSWDRRPQKKQPLEGSLEDKQEKANRIISEAIARARERGEKNIPRVMSPESFPCSSAHKAQRSHQAQAKEKSSKRASIAASSKSKPNAKIGKIIIKLGKKKKRKNESSEEPSDEEPPPRRSSRDEDLKRRSSRQVKRKKYAEDGDSRLSDEEVRVIIKAKKMTTPLAKEQPMQLFVENPSEEDAAVVDKIMASRFVKTEVSPGVVVEVEEFFVKYKNYSYLHCEWATEQQLLKDRRIQQKIKRFRIKQAQRALFFADIEEEPFNPDYVEVDRVLEMSCCQDKDTGESVVYYLVKWCSLPYEDSTWELQEDVDETKIEEFKQLQAVRPDPRRVERPPPSQWKQRKESREYHNGNRLRDYQLEGVNWLLFNWYNRRNCILADEMGLGKTIQSITFLEEVYHTGIRGPFLIIAPLSTIANWEREFRTWTQLNVIVYHGSAISRQMLQQYEMYFRDSQGHVIDGAYKFQAVITTFEMILGGCPELNAINWRCVIIDEAHRLKNKNCKLLEGFRLMSLEHKVLLTGTPLQNTVEELFSLLHFLEPICFPSEATFMQEFGDLKTEEQVQKLQAILKPMMLRRLKEDVEKKLAPKEETIIEVELTNIQKKYYRAILEKNFSFLAKGASQANVPNLVNTMMELRKCCNHPYLIKGAEEKILEDFREVYSPAAPDFHLQAMVQSAGKLVLIDKLLPKMKAGGHKVLIFSQMVRCLDILEDYLIQKRYLYERIDGRVRGNLRQVAIDRFSKPDSDRFVFLLCTRAGGLGINLTAADTCIIFDSDWNPQNDLQAQARCHRIGQNKAVKVYRLITRNSYEREMFDRASLKLGLDKAVLQSMSGRENTGSGQIQQQLSKKEIEDLLRRGAYGALMDEEDEGSKFCEEDIDQILQRRTKTITIESEGRGSTFAKASFVASGNRTDISLDDPNFWDKWAKKAEIDMNAVNGRNSLVIDTPRVRKQTRPFSATKNELAELSERESVSDGEDKPKLRRPYDRLSYGRTECFRVEKNLLVYGWGRWKDILQHGRFKRQLGERDVEAICRALLAYCLVHYRGDDRIKSFMWDLIAPSEDGRTRELQNHLGLSTPVPRGRKGKRMKNQSMPFDIQKAAWIQKHNPEHILQDDGYKKHLKHHCNKVLLRVRMLYYLKQEVVGKQSQKVLDGVDCSEIEIWVPELDHSELPALWWDRVADKCLLLGVYKHGYEKYNTVRADPALCFLERVGRPDEKAIAAEQRAGDCMDGDADDPEYKPAPALLKDDMEDDASSPGDLVISDSAVEGNVPMEGDTTYWPPPSALTARLRRLITASQRYTKSRQILNINQTQQACLNPSINALLPPVADPLNPKMAAKMERQQRCKSKTLTCWQPFLLRCTTLIIFFHLSRWTRREEADFYRVVSTFGVVFDPDAGRFDWTKFRAMARLHKKTDESLQKYLWAFTDMCRRVCRLPPREGDPTDPSITIQPITEERASRTLYRIELLRKVREQVLRHPQLYERLLLCQPGPDLPVWWEPGRHDHDLLIGAAKHGVSRTDYHILRDPELTFIVAQSSYSQHKGNQSRTPTPLLQPHSQPVPAGSSPATQSRTLDTQVPQGDGPHIQLKQEPFLEEEDGEKTGQPEGNQSPTTPAGPAKGEAARTKPLTPSSTSGKQKESGRQGQREARRGLPSRSRSSSSSSSRSSSSSSSSCSHSGSSSSSSSSTASSGSSSSSEDSGSEGEECKETMCDQREPVSSLKGFDEDSVASLGTPLHEMQDSYLSGSGPASSNPFQGGYMLAASYWPKDRVMINRLDSICQAVLKGRWPTARRTYEGAAVSSFYTTKLMDSPTGPRDEPSASPQMSKVKKHVPEKEFTVQINDQEGGLKLTFQKQGSSLKRPLEGEEPAGQQQYLARLQELQSASDTSLPDFSKVMPSSAQVHTKLNGLVDGQPVMKKRRGRRKNVEGVSLMFMNKSRAPAVSDHVPPGWYGSAPGSPAVVPTAGYGQPQGSLDTETRVPVISLRDGTRLTGDDAPKRKDLEQWLKQHPGFVADVGASIPGLDRTQIPAGRPKQKRHRCRNPNKMDVNSLTGEERVQIINRRNARKVGGAFAPQLKDLSRFLQENPEYGVPPEWADVVKRSGYLPESMFDRILTGPIVPEEVSRRGRRPKSMLSRTAAAASTNTPAVPLNPLLASGLLSAMDLPSLQALQQNLQSLQSLQLTAGLMGLPATDTTSLATMFPMLLSGMAGLPNLLGISGLMGKPQESAVGPEEGKEKGSTTSDVDSTASRVATCTPEETSDVKSERTEGQGVEPPISEASASSTLSPASALPAATAAATNPLLALNPLLLSSVLYPGMLLTPGLSLPAPSTAQPCAMDMQQQKEDTNLPNSSKETPPEPLQDRAAQSLEEQSEEQKENSTEEGSRQAESSSSSESGSSSSSSEDSDSSEEDGAE